MDPLDFLFCNGLVVDGTVVRYDDWGSGGMWQGGEGLAHLHITERHSVRWQCHGSGLWVVRSFRRGDCRVPWREVFTEQHRIPSRLGRHTKPPGACSTKRSSKH
eukprot:gene2165-2742_t